MDEQSKAQSDPIMIVLHGEGDEIKGSYSRVFIPWRILKAALNLATNINADDPTEEDMDRMAGLIVEAFGNQFSIEDLNNHADIGDVLDVLNKIVAKAAKSLPKVQNPVK